MKIENTKQLQKLINLCHKNNIMSIEVDGIKLELGAKPLRSKSVSNEIQTTMTVKDLADKVVTNELTPEELLYYSSGAQ